MYTSVEFLLELVKIIGMTNSSHTKLNVMLFMEVLFVLKSVNIIGKQLDCTRYRRARVGKYAKRGKQLDCTQSRRARVGKQASRGKQPNCTRYRRARVDK